MKAQTQICYFFYWLGFFWLILLLLLVCVCMCEYVCVLGFRVSGATVVRHGISGSLMMMMKKMSDQAEKLGQCVCV